MSEGLATAVYEESTTPEVLFAFGMRRSGHHGIITWLQRCLEAQGKVTAHVDDAYCEHLHYFSDEEPRVVPMEEVRREAARCHTLLISVEDYSYAARQALPAYAELGSEASQIRDLVIVRDWPNLVASRLALTAKDAAAGRPTLVDRMSWDDMAALWREYATIAATEPAGVDVISYNRWVGEPGYDDRVAARYGVTSLPERKQTVPFNGGGSSFDGQSLDGNAAAMNTAARWLDLQQALVPTYAGIVSSFPENDTLSRGLFGLDSQTALADLATRGMIGVAPY